MDLSDLLAHDIFIADGGVDDFRDMDDATLKGIVRDYLWEMSEDADSLQMVVNAAKRLEI
jgi:hypothetical protein